MNAPSDLARAHTLADLARRADDMAEGARLALPLAARPEDKEYLAARAQVAQSVADRLRNSPGFST